ncbi:MAG: hypothetical protein LBF51_00995 [Zoogloeaceae bacterium]|jgi:uncharacterized membrane protein|nr:hypothetical protein [Zoogloeaceae bacterium]
MSAFPLPPAAFTGASRRVATGNLFDWLRQGWATFRAAPLHWLGMGGVFSFGLLLCAHVLADTGLLSGVALPAILLTFMSAAMLYACAHSPHPALFYRLFSGQPSLVVPVALLSGIAFLVFLAVGTLLTSLALGLFGNLSAASSGPALLFMLLSAPPFFLFGFLLFQAVSVIGLFTLLLVMPHAMSIGAALTASAAAYQKNLLCFTLFAPILAIILFLGLCTLGLGFVVFFPVLFATLHAAYRDIFAGV